MHGEVRPESPYGGIAAVRVGVPDLDSAAPEDTGYVHGLAVRWRFAGKGLNRELLR